MRAIPIQILSDGSLRMAPDAQIAPETQLTLVALESSEIGDLAALAQLSGSFHMIADEPELYSDADISPENLNPDFAGNARR